MQILANKTTGDVLVYTRGEWNTHGEFRIPDYGVVEAVIADNQVPVSVNAFGDPEPHGDGIIYRQAVVETVTDPEYVGG
jgi:hypothetical protein